MARDPQLAPWFAHPDAEDWVALQAAVGDFDVDEAEHFKYLYRCGVVAARGW